MGRLGGKGSPERDEKRDSLNKRLRDEEGAPELGDFVGEARAGEMQTR